MRRECASGVVQEISQGQTARLRMRHGAVLLYATMRQKRWVAQMKICMEMMQMEAEGDEAIWDLKGDCDTIEKMKVKKVGSQRWIIRFYTRLGVVYELTVTSIKMRDMIEDEKLMDWVESDDVHRL